VLKTLRNAFKTPDIRNKILFSIALILIYRFGAVVPVPFVNADVLSTTLKAAEGSIFTYLNILSGDAFSKATLFALSISPYITASIVVQLLCVAIPALEKLSKSGDEGQKKIQKITRYITCGLGLVTAFGYYMYMKNNDALTDTGVFAAIVIIACYAAGAALIMWLAEQIDARGIGNGISLILFANIVSSGPTIVGIILNYIQSTDTYASWGIVIAEAIIITGLAIIIFDVFITNSERRLPIQYAKKVVGRKQYGGQSTNLPLKLNMTGVMPIIFAQSIVSIPSTVALIFPDPEEGTFWYGFLQLFNYNSWLYVALFFILIIAFAYFYILISFNPVEVANNLKKNGGFIPGIRPGKPTSDYITKELNKVTLIGAIFLDIVAVFPMIVNIVSGSSLGSIAFGGSSILIVVGVALETYRELESQMTMRHYKGFLD